MPNPTRMARITNHSEAGQQILKQVLGQRLTRRHHAPHTSHISHDFAGALGLHPMSTRQEHLSQDASSKSIDRLVAAKRSSALQASHGLGGLRSRWHLGPAEEDRGLLRRVGWFEGSTGQTVTWSSSLSFNTPSRDPHRTGQTDHTFSHRVRRAAFHRRCRGRRSTCGNGRQVADFRKVKLSTLTWS